MLPDCDCGACCEQCGHESNCIRNESEDDMASEEARGASNLMTVAEVAAELRVSRMTVYRLIGKGVLGALRIGGSDSSGAIRIPEAELYAYKKRAAMPATYTTEESA